MCQWMFTNVGWHFWGWTMMLGTFLIGVLTTVALVLLIALLMKKIKK